MSTTPDVGLRGADDAAQAAFVLAERRVLVTQDEDFLTIHASGLQHFGVVYCKKGSRSLGEMIRGLVLLWEVYVPEEMTGRVEFL